MRTGVAATAALIAASNLAAQRPAAARPRDSIVVRVLGPGMSPDSLRVLVREFDHEQAGSQRFIVLSERIDSVLRAAGAVAGANEFVRRMFAGAGAGRMMMDNRQGWLGFYTQGPSVQSQTRGGDLYVTHFTHPLIVSVDPASPADKAGITAGDMLVAYNGIDVVNHEFNLATLLKPESKITVTVRRDGEPKDYQLTVAKAPQQISERRIAFQALPALASDVPVRVDMRRTPAGTIVRAPGEGLLPSVMPAPGSVLMITPNGVFGASVSPVNADLAKALNLKAGVLVNDVPEDSPAWRAGLRTGDVITAVEDQPVVSLVDLRRRVAARVRDGAVALQVARNQKTRTVTVSLAPSP